MILNYTGYWFQVWKVAGHGRLMDPPSRNSMWRFGFYNPVDVYDNELWCGGLKGLPNIDTDRNREIINSFTVQWELNGGKCGVCGDPWNEPKPRSHEIGGIFANGKLVRQYTTGQVIDIEIELTSNHKGYFEMRLCPLIGNVVNAETEECFNKYLHQNEYKYILFYTVCHLMIYVVIHSTWKDSRLIATQFLRNPKNTKLSNIAFNFPKESPALIA